MSSGREVRIIVKEGAKGNQEISTYDPVSGREIATGLKGGEREVHQLKETLERAGNRVSVKEL